MLKIGDKIVYPMHGAGIIESIEEKEVLGVKNKYYIMRIPIDEMRVMIPMDNIEALGIRKVINKKQAEAVLQILSEKATTMDKNWNKRYRQNELILKNGDIFGIAEIVKNLMILDKAKKLSTGEKKILINARQILISELMLALCINKEEMENKLENTINYDCNK